MNLLKNYYTNIQYRIKLYNARKFKNSSKTSYTNIIKISGFLFLESNKI